MDSGLVEDIGGIYFGPFYMHCPAPPSRQRRSVEGEPSPMGYHLSISNDGHNFTEELTLLVYNTLCHDCNITTMICSELVSMLIVIWHGQTCQCYYNNINNTAISVKFKNLVKNKNRYP